MIYLIVTLLCMTGGQLMLKHGLNTLDQPSISFSYLFKALSNTFIIGSVVLMLVAALSWVFALSKGQLSSLYPFMGLSYVLIAVFGVLFLKESLSLLSWLGIFFISGGVYLVMR